MPDLPPNLARLPARPGVYIMKDGHGKILYVGKAKRLDRRVRSYFRAGGTDHPKQAAFVPRVRAVETVVTDSEVEALILEMTLIKEKRPPYNIQLKDDKRFPFLKITTAEPFPKAVITRRTPRDGSRYFGPYTDVGALRRTMKTLRSVFPIRSCMGKRPGRGPRYQECLDFHIHRCAGPCIGAISQEEYRKLVDRLVLFLSGHEDQVVAELRREMDAASAAREYERAAALRDRIEAVGRLRHRQKMLDTQERDLDVFAFARDEETAHGVVLQVRAGRVLGKESRRLAGVRGQSDGEVMFAFLTQYYRGRERVPAEVLCSASPVDMPLLERWLEKQAGSRVSLRVPRRGRFAGLAHLAEENARLDLEAARGESVRGGLAPEVYALQKALGLASPPVHIEGFDISNIQGAQPVASAVVFHNARPLRSAYRRYRMRSPERPNDFAMMAEVVARRAARILAGEFPVPDLFLVDGGKGQVSAARTALEQEGLEGVPLVGLAKKEELIVVPGRRDPLRLARRDPALLLLMRIRDEAHRFAVSFHRTRRAKAFLASPLDEIPGVGEARKLRLLDAFGSVDDVARATVEEIAAVPGIGPALARAVHDALRPAREASHVA